MTDGVNLQKHQINVLEVKNLKKIYGPRTVVKDVSLSIKSGEVVGLLGPNGAGKTTTFYMIVGLVAANGGQILLNGESIQHLPIYKRARIGITYLPQENSVFRTLTVEENIQAILELQTNEDGSPFPAGNAVAQKSPAPWPLVLVLFCSTNRLPVSTRLR